MHAPIACIGGLPPLTSFSKKPLSMGLNRTAVWVGRNNALRSRVLPVFESLVRFLTLVPLRNSRGDRPQYAAALSALGNRSTAGNSARIVVAVWRPTPGIDSKRIPCPVKPTRCSRLGVRSQRAIAMSETAAEAEPTATGETPTA